jgi:DNA polymerase phi
VIISTIHMAEDTSPPTRPTTGGGGGVSSALNVYNELTRPEPEARLAAASSLVVSLVAEQRAFEAATGKGKDKKKAKKSSDDDEEETTSAADASSNWCPSVTYALKRLVRGLASSRVSARQGFALALTEVYTPLSNVSRWAIIQH